MSSLPDYAIDINAVLKDTAKWVTGCAPDYSIVNKLYAETKSANHEFGSLEDIVNNLVKNWEKEVSHKSDPNEWRTVDPNGYKFSTNGGKWLSVEDMIQLGTYKATIGDCLYFKSDCLTLEQSKHIFHGCFSEGFAWECLQVYSPPPTVAFKWRHWGKMSGKLKCPVNDGKYLESEASNEVIEIFGVTIARLSDKLQITELETFFNPTQLLEPLVKNRTCDE